MTPALRKLRAGCEGMTEFHVGAHTFASRLSALRAEHGLGYEVLGPCKLRAQFATGADGQIDVYAVPEMDDGVVLAIKVAKSDWCSGRAGHHAGAEVARAAVLVTVAESGRRERPGL